MRSFIVIVQRGRCDQLVDFLLIGCVSQHYQPSGSKPSGVCVLVGSSLLSPEGIFSIYRTAQRYCYVYPLSGNQDLSPNCTIDS